MKIWLDDKREMPEGYDVWAKNAYFAIGLILGGRVTHVSFDHDLGLFGKDTSLDPNNTGYYVAKTIKKLAARNEIDPITWEIHTSNPVGRKNIRQAMMSAKRFWDNRDKKEKVNHD
jgi:hypothetical protein